MNLEATRQSLAFHPVSQALQEFPEMAKSFAEVHATLGAHHGETRCVRVDRELRHRSCLALLESGVMALDEPRAGDLGLRGGDDENDAEELAQRRALFRRPKKPWSSSRDA